MKRVVARAVGGGSRSESSEEDEGEEGTPNKMRRDKSAESFPPPKAPSPHPPKEVEEEEGPSNAVILEVGGVVGGHPVNKEEGQGDAGAVNQNPNAAALPQRSLEDLPTELLQKIVYHLEPKQRHRVRSLSRRMRLVTQEVWRDVQNLELNFRMIRPCEERECVERQLTDRKRHRLMERMADPLDISGKWKKSMGDSKTRTGRPSGGAKAEGQSTSKDDNIKLKNAEIDCSDGFESLSLRSASGHSKHVEAWEVEEDDYYALDGTSKDQDGEKRQDSCLIDDNVDIQRIIEAKLIGLNDSLSADQLSSRPCLPLAWKDEEEEEEGKDTSWILAGVGEEGSLFNKMKITAKIHLLSPTSPHTKVTYTYNINGRRLMNWLKWIGLRLPSLSLALAPSDFAQGDKSGANDTHLLPEGPLHILLRLRELTPKLTTFGATMCFLASDPHFLDAIRSYSTFRAGDLRKLTLRTEKCDRFIAHHSEKERMFRLHRHLFHQGHLAAVQQQQPGIVALGGLGRGAAVAPPNVALGQPLPTAPPPALQPPQQHPHHHPHYQMLIHHIHHQAAGGVPDDDDDGGDPMPFVPPLVSPANDPIVQKLQELLNASQGIESLDLDEILIAIGRRPVDVYYPNTVKDLRVERLGNRPGEASVLFNNCPRLEKVSMSGRVLNVADYASLQQLRELRSLTLTDLGPSHQVFGNDGGEPWAHLHTLCLKSCEMNDATLRAFATNCPRLRNLHLELKDHNSLSESGPRALCRLEQLENLEIDLPKSSLNAFNDICVELLSDHCPNLVSVVVPKSKVSLLSLPRMLRMCRSLKKVDLGLRISLNTLDAIVAVRSIASDLQERTEGIRTLVKLTLLDHGNYDSLARILDGIPLNCDLLLSELRDYCLHDMTSCAFCLFSGDKTPKSLLLGRKDLVGCAIIFLLTDPNDPASPFSH